MTGVEPHYHRCKECNDRMDHGCIDRSCAEGVRWVIMCLVCYERMLEALKSEASW